MRCKLGSSFVGRGDLAGRSSFDGYKDLLSRIVYTLILLVVYRVGTHIPIPGIDPVVLQDFLERTRGSVLDMFNVFAGGAVSRMAVLTLGIMPYVSASIIMQLIVAMVPSLSELKKEGGERGRVKINNYTRFATVILALVQGYSISLGLNSQGLFLFDGHYIILQSTVTLVGGTMFLMWLGDRISARGIGNGISLIIFVGIVAEIPSAFVRLFEAGRIGSILPYFVVLGILLGFSIIYFVVFCERAQRKIPVQYPRRQVGSKMFQAERSHLPLRINSAGVIPPIFASSVLLLPATIISFSTQSNSEGVLSWISTYLGHGQPLYILTYACMIIFFAFFYTSFVLNPVDMADNLKQNGGFVPGIRPGEKTAEYLDYVLSRLTAFGSIYLAVVCVVPEFIVQRISLPFYFGGTSLLIIVSVTMDLMNQVQSHIYMRKYKMLAGQKLSLGKKNR